MVKMEEQLASQQKRKESEQRDVVSGGNNGERM